jgi:hypothetical protein
MNVTLRIDYLLKRSLFAGAEVELGKLHRLLHLKRMEMRRNGRGLKIKSP